MTAAAATAAVAHLVVRDLRLERPGRVLVEGLSFSLPRGAFLAVVGPSGAGKSTLLHALAGLLPPASGEVSYADPGRGALPPRGMRGNLGLVFQDLRLVPTMPLLDNVMLARLGRVPWWRTVLGLPADGRDEAWHLLESLGLTGQDERWAAEASGGEQQRTALARALFLEPHAILADEPVSALDASGAVAALEVLRAGASRLKATVVCVLHDQELVRRFADHVLTLDPGTAGAWTFEATGVPQGHV